MKAPYISVVYGLGLDIWTNVPVEPLTYSWTYTLPHLKNLAISIQAYFAHGSLSYEPSLYGVLLAHGHAFTLITWHATMSMLPFSPQWFSFTAIAVMGWITMFPWWARDGNIKYQPYLTYLTIIEKRNQSKPSVNSSIIGG